MKFFILIISFILLFKPVGSAQGSCDLPSVIDTDLVLDATCTSYAAAGSITVNEGVTLTISAGVVILLPLNANIQVNGSLVVNGTEENPVIIQNLNAEEKWGRISGNSANLDLNYVNFVNATAAISANYGIVILRNCSIDNMISGDAIAIHYSTEVILENNEIIGVPGSGKIDAIDCDGIVEGTISGNHIYNFPDDAIDIGTGSTGVQIHNNYLHNCGSFGISIGESSEATISKNIITYCLGGGIQSHTGSNVFIDRNTHFANFIDIECHHRTPSSPGSAIVQNSIFSNAQSKVFDIQTGSTLEITYSLSDIEVLAGEGNLLGKAGFIDTLNSDFHLHSHSPAIDSGDPDSDGDGITYETDLDDQDPDGTRVDMGAIYYHHHPDLAYWTLRINEFSAINSTFICPETGLSSDWIEIYNYGPDSVNLKGLNVTDDLTIPNKWQIPSNLILEPDSFIILWADGLPAEGPDHLDFKLSGTGEQLGLYTPISLQHIDSYVYGTLFENISLGKNPSDNLQWVYFTNPTPGSINIGPVFFGITPSPLFSLSGGFYDTPFSITISSSDPSDQIYFTEDSHDPTELSTTYTGDIQIEQTKIVRAIAVRQDYLPSRPVSHIYYLNANYQLPVLAILTDPDNLFGDTGIYTWPWGEGDYWEKFVQNQYFIDHQLKFSVNSGLRIQGGNSLNMPKKSFREFYESEYGNPRLGYPLFNNTTVTSFKNIVLRSGYDDDITTSTGTLLRDPLSADLYRKSGALATASEWAVLFLNDDYWGIYNLRESINEYFIEDHTGFTYFDLIRYLKEGTELKYGTLDDWNNLTQYIQTTDFSIQENYSTVCDMMDMANFINLLSFVHASQFRSWTWGSFAYKSKSSGSKWRWTIWDTDRAYTLLTWNGFNEYQYTNNEKWANFMPKAFLSNPSFKNDLINRTCDLLNTLFLPQNSIAAFDSLASIIDPEIPNEIQRWNPSMTNWETRKESIRNFLRSRPQEVRNQIRTYFGLSGQYTITLNVTGFGHIEISTIPVQDFPWEGIYMNSIPISLKAIPASGYKFTGWDNPSLPDTFHVEINPTLDMSVTAFFEIDTTAINELPVIINEIMYNPAPQYDSEDWIEIYNPNAVSLDLTGWIFKDQNDDHKFLLPVESTIDAYGYLIVARNSFKFKQTFPFVANVVGDFGSGVNGFGLSSQGEILRIHNPGGELIDYVYYGVTSPWPVLANGNGPSIELLDPGLDNNIGSNWISSPVNLFSPGESNSISGMVNPDYRMDQAFDFKLFPNPFYHQITLEFEAHASSLATIQVYNLYGHKIDEIKYGIDGNGPYQIIWNPSDRNANLSSGIYLIKLDVFGDRSHQVKTKQVLYLK